MKSSSLSLGGIVLIDWVEKQFRVFSEVFSGIGGRARDFVGCVKLHSYNKLTDCVSTCQIPETYSPEVAFRLGLEGMPSERSLYRALERTGRSFTVVLDRHQRLIERHGLVDVEQVVDFSSTYLEGVKAQWGELGYSRDHRPDRPQINFGISTGLNHIPTALTVQRGNVQDKKHMKYMLRVVSEVIPKNSLLIFDTGANTQENKAKILDIGCQYLTLKPKKVGVYCKNIRYFRENLDRAVHFTMNERHYTCVKKLEDGEVHYILFCPDLYETHIQAKEKKFQRQKKKGNLLLKKRKTTSIPSDRGWVELIPHLQKTLYTLDNPYINGVEGFFILESSVDDHPEKILKLYKNKDKAEKFIRALKEGLELRPIRHWNKWAILGLFFVCFLTNFLINLTQNLRKKENPKPAHTNPKPELQNVKLLKKYLTNLTLTVVYPENHFKYTLLSNITPQIQALFGNFIQKYNDKPPDLRW